MRLDEGSKGFHIQPTQIPSSLGVMAISFEFILYFVHLALTSYCPVLLGRGVHVYIYVLFPQVDHKVFVTTLYFSVIPTTTTTKILSTLQHA